MSENNTTITLCDVPITPTHQIDSFLNLQQQEQFFMEHATHTYYDCRYQTRTSRIKVMNYVEEVRNSNYGFYRNTYKGQTKTYYFWILSKTYLAQEVTEIEICLDVFQTWLFDINFSPCMIERCHVKNDNVGRNTYPEDFETGDFIVKIRSEISELKGKMAYFLAYSNDEGKGYKYGKTYHGFDIIYFNEDSIDAMNTFIKNLCEQGKADAIAFIFCYPDNMVDGSHTSNVSYTGSEIKSIEKSYQINFGNFSFAGDSYTPYNNKLYTYPYSFIKVSNSNGDNTILKYENFTIPNDISFRLDGLITMNPTFTLTPRSYNGKTDSYDDSISEKGFGLCSWNNDNFANWYAQNSNTITANKQSALMTYNAQNTVARNSYNQAMLSNNTALENATINSIASGVGSALTLNGGGVANSMLGGYMSNSNYNVATAGAKTDLDNANILNATDYSNTIACLMASVSDKSVQPNTCKGDTSSSGLDMARGTATFFIDEMQIKPEYAKKIDMYFQMFGYKVNEVLNPRNIMKNRKKWNYIKTVNCNCNGNIPSEDRDAINNLFNNGITLWHDENYMFNYDQRNDIL